jgi:hypothetical protein
MRRATILVLAAVLVLVAAPAVQAAPPASGFTGHWEGIDPLDGSELDVYFFGGSPSQIVYTDAGAPVTCGDPSNQFFSSFLTGKIDGDELSSTMHWARCGTVTLTFLARFEITWYLDDQGDSDPANDVLTNDFPDETYSRAS